VIHAEAVAYDVATDGCFALITNDIAMTPAEVLAAYRHQPHLERRHHMLKGAQEVAPVYLRAPQCIEALLLCHFLAMLAEALIEREGPHLHEGRRPSRHPALPRAARLSLPQRAAHPRGLPRRAARHQLISEGEVVQSFEPRLTALQRQVLDLLHVPASVYPGASPS